MFKDAAAQAALSRSITSKTVKSSQESAAAEIAAGTVSLQERLRLHGDVGQLVVLLLLALFSTMPITGIDSIIGLAIFVLAWRWVRNVETITVHGWV